jgi:hypothetical protein
MRLPSPLLNRRKKNPSTISRSRSLASWAERRVVLGPGGNVSNTAPSTPTPGEFQVAVAFALATAPPIARDRDGAADV